MAAIKDRRWSKRDIGYRFVDTRDFGAGMRQADIERIVERALGEWAPHCGLNFKRVETNPDIMVKWAKLAKQPNGNVTGGNANEGGTPVTITFNDDAHWMAWQFDSDFVDFFYTALHELGHAIGLDHSDDSGAIMYPVYSHPDLTPRFLQGLGFDDAAGARVLYAVGPLDPNPSNPNSDKLAILSNRTDTAVEFKFYVTGDGAMSADLGHGSIKPHNITYWKEKRDLFNSQRLYRLRVEGGGQTAVLDGIPPLTTLSIYHNDQGQLGIFWPGMRQ